MADYSENAVVSADVNLKQNIQTMKNNIIFTLVLILTLTTSCNSQDRNRDRLEEEAAVTPIDKIIHATLEDPVDSDTIEVGIVEKTEEEWREILTPGEFEILREGGTEPAFRNQYYNNDEEGVYYCGACGLPVYSSQTKFHSGTGWPSFWAPIDSKVVERRPDTRFGMRRTEVICAQCGSHFGHIFEYEGVPTEERHCLNSLALDFKPMDL